MSEISLAQYIQMLEAIDYRNRDRRADFTYDLEAFPSGRWRDRSHGRSDVTLRYRLQGVGLVAASGITGVPTRVPHSATDVIKDKIANEGWFPGAPTVEQLKSMDGFSWSEREREEASELFLAASKKQQKLIEKRKRKEEKEETVWPTFIPTHDKTLHIIFYYKQKWSLEAIADLYHTTPTTIRRVLERARVKKSYRRAPRRAPLTSQTG